SPVSKTKRAIAVIHRQWLARACPPEFSSNHGLVWLMIGYSRDPPTSVPVRARSVDAPMADIAKRLRHVREVPKKATWTWLRTATALDAGVTEMQRMEGYDRSACYSLSDQTVELGPGA